MARRKRVSLPATVIHWDQPCKNGQPFVAADGSCLRCGADQGVACPTTCTHCGALPFMYPCQQQGCPHQWPETAQERQPDQAEDRS